MSVEIFFTITVKNIGYFIPKTPREEPITPVYPPWWWLNSVLRILVLTVRPRGQLLSTTGRWQREPIENDSYHLWPGVVVPPSASLPGKKGEGVSVPGQMQLPHPSSHCLWGCGFLLCVPRYCTSSSGACVRESRTQTVCHQVKFPLLQLPVAFAPLIPHMLHYPSVCWLSTCTDSLRLGFWTSPMPVVLWGMGQGQDRPLGVTEKASR